jgi:hypothetical protein
MTFASGEPLPRRDGAELGRQLTTATRGAAAARWHRPRSAGDRRTDLVRIAHDRRGQRKDDVGTAADDAAGAAHLTAGRSVMVAATSTAFAALRGNDHRPASPARTCR